MSNKIANQNYFQEILTFIMNIIEMLE